MALIILSLCLGGVAWMAFLWAANRGQFEEVEDAKYRMLEDDSEPLPDPERQAAAEKEADANRGDAKG